MGEDQLEDLELDGPITLSILDESVGTSTKRNDECDERPLSVAA